MEGPVARWYAKTTLADLEEFRREAREIALRLAPNARVLEIAPGPGYFAIELAKLGSFRITGLDISQTFVEIAQRNAREQSVNVEFRHGNASAMPFESGSFDFIYCRAAFKNFSQPLEAINEMYRVLRPHGQAVIGDLRRDVTMNEINAYVKASGRNWFDSILTRLAFRTVLIRRAYTTQDFRDLAEKSGFGKCRPEPTGIGLRVYFEKPEQIALVAR